MRYYPSVDKDYGIYRATVAVNQDGLKLGRVRVRIPCFHGDNETGVRDADLPWATVCMQGASSESGAFIVPEVNSTVMVVFENGNHDSPVVVGSVYSNGHSDVRYLYQSPKAYIEDDRGFPEGDEFYFRNMAEGERMVPAFLHDVVEEAQKDTATKVVYQSPKGAYIIIRDKDGSEVFEIRDANGQFLKFASPMASDKTKDNKHKWNPPAKNLLSRARTILSNALGQRLTFFSDGNTGDIDLVETLSKMGLEIDGDEKKCRLFNHSGQLVEVSLTDGNVKVQSNGAIVEVTTDSVSVKGTKVTIEAPSVDINGTNIGLNGAISVNGSITSNGPVTVGGVEMGAHKHTCPDGTTSSPQGGAGGKSGPNYSAPNNEIKAWEEEV